MLKWLAKRADASRKAENLYGAVVAQAREPAFYVDFGINDTLEGRYELIVLHMFLVLEKLREAFPGDTRWSRILIERFVTDMDDCMRELGVGDMTVPKRVKGAAAGLYGRAQRYREASGLGQDALAVALSEFICAEPTSEFRAQELAAYVLEAARVLKEIDPEDMLAGILKLPDPNGFVERKELS